MKTSKVFGRLGLLAGLGAGFTAPYVSAAGPNDVPIAGTATFQVQNTFTSDPNCPISTILTGMGTISHLGRTAIVATSCSAPVDNTFTFLSSAITFTAANGDTMTGTFSGTYYPTGNGTIYEFRTASTPYGTLSITGGTGRFTNASGMSELKSTQDFATHQGVALFTGSISYPH